MEDQVQPIQDDNRDPLAKPLRKTPRLEPCSSAGLASRIDLVRELVMQLEEAHATNNLDKLMSRCGSDSLVGTHLLEHYQHLFENSPRRSDDFRQYWVKYALDAFSYSLRPPVRIYEARFEESSHTTDSKGVVSKGWWKLIVSHDGATEHIDYHQIESCRYWGIWFDLGEPELDARITSFILWGALARLVSDLSGIAQMERALLQGGTKLDKARIEVVGSGAEFTRLIHDVLNENDRVAQFARLIEDVMERTDLRLRYAGLGRKNGARTQISFASREEHHRTKWNQMHLNREYVFISPYGIAQTIIHASNMPFMKEVDWHAFWTLCGIFTDDVELLAGVLKRHFNQARYQAADHPKGTVGILHPEIKRVIRVIASHEAFAATNQLRWRELKRGPFRHKSRHRRKSDANED